jgi:flavin reductase (DIM6/NTAB) family NADH-FMN oxidoreductase RutF
VPEQSISDAFGELVERLDGPMVVVTVAGRGPEGEVDGCLVGFHGQASIDPPRYVVWLSTANRTYRLAADPSTTHVAVHILTVSDGAAARWFGGETGDEVDKLTAAAWVPGLGGAPLLEALPERFVGRVVERIDPAQGDHLGVVLEPVAVDVLPGVREPALRLAQALDIDPGHPA